MRIHSDILAPSDIHRATVAAGMRGVAAEVSTHGSRKRRTAYDVILTGTSTHRPNGWYRDRDESAYAATWDEWGMFLSALFEQDPDMVTPYYADANDFHIKTGDRFKMLTAPYQHGGSGHKWQYNPDTGRQECVICEAVQNR